MHTNTISLFNTNKMAMIRGIRTIRKKGIDILMKGVWKIAGCLVEMYHSLDDFMNGYTTGFLNHDKVLHGNEMKALRAIQ